MTAPAGATSPSGNGDPLEIWGVGPERHLDDSAAPFVLRRRRVARGAVAGRAPCRSGARPRTMSGSAREDDAALERQHDHAPSPARRIDTLLSLWGFSSSDVCGGRRRGRRIHWDGQRWWRCRPGTTLYIYGLWGARPDDVWGVGNGGNRVHWNGAERSRRRSWATRSSSPVSRGRAGRHLAASESAAGRSRAHKASGCRTTYGVQSARTGTVARLGQVSGVWTACRRRQRYAPSHQQRAAGGDRRGDRPTRSARRVCAADLTSQVNALVDDLQRRRGHVRRGSGLQAFDAHGRVAEQTFA